MNELAEPKWVGMSEAIEAGGASLYVHLYKNRDETEYRHVEIGKITFSEDDYSTDIDTPIVPYRSFACISHVLKWADDAAKAKGLTRIVVDHISVGKN